MASIAWPRRATCLGPLLLRSAGYQLPTIPTATHSCPTSALIYLVSRWSPRHFTSSPVAHAELPANIKAKNTAAPTTRKARSTVGKASLRRVAVEAQRHRDGKSERIPVVSRQQNLKTVTAICAAEEYNVGQITKIFERMGHRTDPYGTDLFPQVVHAAPSLEDAPPIDGVRWTTGDIFIFPSGTVVAWDMPAPVLRYLVGSAFAPAAMSALKQYEEEDLEYVEDTMRDTSHIRGDTIILGVGTERVTYGEAQDAGPSSTDSSDSTLRSMPQGQLATVLAKIAFSSGLARSTKLGVLERSLADYFESTKSIPEVMSRGGRIPYTRSFISQKTGQLLSIRAQLNLYSELTDSLPDLFWDSRHDLGLEGYYDQVGKALDTNIRIKILNEKMDHAQEIASVLRQQLSEKHGIRLEWIIILLIAVEVVFAIEKELKEYRTSSTSVGPSIPQTSSNVHTK